MNSKYTIVAIKHQNKKLWIFYPHILLKYANPPIHFSSTSIEFSDSPQSFFREEVRVDPFLLSHSFVEDQKFN